MDDFIGIAIISIVAASFLAAALSLVSQRRRRLRVRESSRDLAAALGLDFIEGEAAFRKFFEEAGQGENPVRLEQLPPALLRLYRPESYWRMEGERHGVRVAVFTETRQGSKSSTTYIIARAYLPAPPDFRLALAREGFFTRVGKALFGLQDIETGDAAFDAAFRVKSSEPDAARLFLGRPGLRAALLEAQARWPSLSLTGAWVHWERVGMVGEKAELSAVLDALARIAAASGGP